MRQMSMSGTSIRSECSCEFPIGRLAELAVIMKTMLNCNDFRATHGVAPTCDGKPFPDSPITVSACVARTERTVVPIEDVGAMPCIARERCG
jgi:hypothetical protein